MQVIKGTPNFNYHLKRVDSDITCHVFYDRIRDIPNATTCDSIEDTAYE